MTPARYQRLMDLFAQAPPEAGAPRSSFIASVRAEDPTLADELMALLAEDRARGDLLDSHAGRLELAARVLGSEGPDDATDAGPGGPAVGTLLAGRYELAEELGADAMGHVYRAHDRALGMTWRSSSCAPTSSTSPTRWCGFAASFAPSRASITPAA